MRHCHGGAQHVVPDSGEEHAGRRAGCLNGQVNGNSHLDTVDDTSTNFLLC